MHPHRAEQSPDRAGRRALGQSCRVRKNLHYLSLRATFAPVALSIEAVSLVTDLTALRKELIVNLYIPHIQLFNRGLLESPFISWVFKAAFWRGHRSIIKPSG